MIERDYLMRLLLNLAQGIMRTIQADRSGGTKRDSAEMLEMAIGEAVDFDGETFLALAPDSIAQILQISGTDARASRFIANSLYLASVYRAEAGDEELARIRREQAYAVAEQFGHEIDALSVTDEEKAVQSVADEAQAFIDAHHDDA